MSAGMITAGETAAKMKPNMKPTVQGNPRIKFESTATAVASTKHGINVALKNKHIKEISKKFY